MGNQSQTGTNILLSVDKIKDLIDSLPRSIFRTDAELRRKKRMANAALRHLGKFLKKLAEAEVVGCGEHARIDPPGPGDPTTIDCGQA